MKAIIETGGKQYSVSEGSEIYVEKLDLEEGKKVVFDKVLMANGVIGNPYVKGASVEGEVVKQGIPPPPLLPQTGILRGLSLQKM